MSIKNIGIIGVGGVGGYFGGKLCRLQTDDSGIRVSFVARGEHLRVIQESGLLLASESDGEQVCRPALATNDFRELPPLDLCLICVKEFDLSAALTALAPLVGENTILLPLLNGVDVHSRVRSVIQNPKGIVLPACVYVGTHIERPGMVRQKGGSCRILFGPDPQRSDFDPQELISLFDQAGIKSEWTLDIQVEIWRKFIFICAYGLVSAACGKTLGEIVRVWRRFEASWRKRARWRGRRASDCLTTSSRSRSRRPVIFLRPPRPPFSGTSSVKTDSMSGICSAAPCYGWRSD